MSSAPKEVARKRALKEAQEAAAEYLMAEKQERDSCEAQYEKEMLKATAEGRDINKDDNAVYLITTFNNGDPTLYGVYTSSTKTKEALPKAFEGVAKEGNFIDGRFQDDPERVAKFDVSEFVSPLMKSGRVMFESHTQKDSCWANYFASVAVNRISLNSNSGSNDVPLLHHWNTARYDAVPLLHHWNISYPYQNEKNGNSNMGQVGKDGKVYVIYGFANFEHYDNPSNFYVKGVYTNKERALKAANIPYPKEKNSDKNDKGNEDIDSFSDEDEESSMQHYQYCVSKDEAQKKQNGLLYSFDRSQDRCVNIQSRGILTVEVDQVVNQTISLHRSDVWMDARPSIFDES